MASNERRTNSDEVFEEEQFCVGGIELPVAASSESVTSERSLTQLDEDDQKLEGSHGGDDGTHETGDKTSDGTSIVLGDGTAGSNQQGHEPGSSRGSQRSSPKSLSVPVDVDHDDDVEEDVFGEVGTYDKVLLFCDYDGTLRDFEDDPMAATPGESLQELLQLLSSFPEKLKPVIISGRDETFLDNYMGHNKGLTLVAEHGYKVRRAFETEWVFNGPSTPDTKDTNWRDTVMEQMKKVSGIAGSFVEEKTKSIVWHYRAVTNPEEGDEGVENLLQFLELVNFPMERVSRGHKMIEVFGPLGPTKGACMRDLICSFLQDSSESALVMSCGDDVTDETMFNVTGEDSEFCERTRQKIVRMVSVKVGTGKTSAKFRAQNPTELKRLLWRLIQRVRDSSQIQKDTSQPNSGSAVTGGDASPSSPILYNGSSLPAVCANQNLFGEKASQKPADTACSKPTLDSLFGAT